MAEKETPDAYQSKLHMIIPESSGLGCALLFIFVSKVMGLSILSNHHSNLTTCVMNSGSVALFQSVSVVVVFCTATTSIRRLIDPSFFAVLSLLLLQPGDDLVVSEACLWNRFISI